MLSRWWWRLDKESGIWQDLVTTKYLRNMVIGNVQPRLHDSPVWKDLLKVKPKKDSSHKW